MSPSSAWAGSSGGPLSSKTPAVATTVRPAAPIATLVQPAKSAGGGPQRTQYCSEQVRPAPQSDPEAQQRCASPPHGSVLASELEVLSGVAVVDALSFDVAASAVAPASARAAPPSVAESAELSPTGAPLIDVSSPPQPAMSRAAAKN